MSYKAWFSREDRTVHRLAKKRVPAADITIKDVLMFNFEAPVSEPGSPPLRLKEPATTKHQLEYKAEYAAFLKSEEKKAEPDPEPVTPSPEPEVESGGGPGLLEDGEG